jgi:hypothetical protein
MKKDLKDMRKVWQTLRSAFKWLLIIILIFLLLSYLKDFLDHYDFLVKKVTTQTHYIDSLQDTVHNLKETNGHLIDQLQIEHSKVQQLEQQLSIKINGEPVHMSVEDIHKEIEPQLKFPSADPSIIPITILGAMTILKTLVFRFAF